MATSRTQQRGSGQPNGQDLAYQLQQLQTMLGIQGANAQAFFQVLDAKGYPRTRIGYLPNGDYGVWIADTNGNAFEVLPEYNAGEVGTLSTASSTPVNLSGPQVTVVIGASGDAIVEANAFITASVSSGTCSPIVYLSVDGATPVGGMQMCVLNSNNNAFGATCASRRRLSQWSSGPGLLNPGSHTFQLWYAQPGPGTGTGNFSQNFLSVQPL